MNIWITVLLILALLQTILIIYIGISEGWTDPFIFYLTLIFTILGIILLWNKVII
jgi:hypothetical protein